MRPRPPEVDTIAIVGVGLIGGSLGLAAKRVGLVRKVVGISRETTISQALELGVIDQGYDYRYLERGIKEADLVFLCTPILRILELLKEVPRYVKPGAIVSDVGSTKARIVSVARRTFPQGVHFIGGHPMAGSERRGVAAADPYLFEDAIYVLTPGNEVPLEVIDRLSGLIGRLGARVVVMGPHTHDLIAAGVSHLPQLIAVSLVNLIGELDRENPDFLRLAAGGFRDLTRIASSPYEVWRDICITNRESIVQMVDRYIERLRGLRQALLEDQLQGEFEEANRTRATIPANSKGFLSPLYEISVLAQDRPGTIAHISTAIAEEGINIKDIEVLKVREGEGGTIRLCFETQAEADRAMEILREAGFEARRRE